MYINTPFNYTGNKFKLLEQIVPHMDSTKSIFVDLFCGGGSVYSNIADKYDEIYANDIITDLIGIHKELVTGNLNFIETVKQICPDKNDKDGFINLRLDYNQNNSPEKLFALMLCSHNNMLRYNKKFEYNQTWGNRSWNDSTEKKVNEFIKNIKPYKNNIHFSNKNFNDVYIKENAFYYIDSPYTSTEAGYNAYWLKDDDDKLYKYCNNINKINSTFMLSGIIGEHKNGKRWELIDKLISDGYNYEIIECNYEKVAVDKNSKNSQEIIIKNY